MASQTVDFLVQTSAALPGQFVTLVSNKDGVTTYSAVTASDLTGKWLINPKPPAGTYTQWIGASQGAKTTQVDQDFVVDPMQDDGTAIFPGLVTIQAGGAAITGPVTINGLVSLTGTPGLILMQGAGDATIVGGTTAFVIANNANNTPNLRITDAGVATFRSSIISPGTIFARNATGVWNDIGDLTLHGTTVKMLDPARISSAPSQLFMDSVGTSQIIGGTTGLAVDNNANTQVNFSTDDVGHFQVRVSIDLTAAGQFLIGPANATSIAMRGPQKSLIVGQSLTSFAAGAQTMTAANLLGGVIEGTPTASVAYTFDTGANIDAGLTGASNGDTFICTLANRAGGAFNITLTAAAGITILGNGVVPQSKVAYMVFRRTGASAWTVYVTVSA